jgi:hypothetical protein
MLASDERLTATALHTVESKGYDSLALAIVGPEGAGENVKTSLQPRRDQSCETPYFPHKPVGWEGIAGRAGTQNGACGFAGSIEGKDKGWAERKLEVQARSELDLPWSVDVVV